MRSANTTSVLCRGGSYIWSPEEVPLYLLNEWISSCTVWFHKYKLVKRSFHSSSSFKSDKVDGQDGDGDQSVEVVAAVKEVALRVFLDRSQSSNLSERKLIFRKEEDERTCDLLQIFLSQCCPSRLLTIGADARAFYYKI